MTMYDRIRELRIQKGMSQNDLALKTGYADRTAISKIEKGQVDIPRSKIQAFANVFGVSPSYLMDGETKTTPSIDDEIVSAFLTLPDDKRKQVIEFIRFLGKKE